MQQTIKQTIHHGRWLIILKMNLWNLKPGSKFKYSNSNYYLLGYILEIVTGKSYAYYLQQNIFTKAGLHNTYYIDTTKNIPNVSQGYSMLDGKLERATLQNVTIIYAAGGIMSNAYDFGECLSKIIW
jgi:CubicO group peptidase (beta-lactamase class C family)